MPRAKLIVGDSKEASRRALREALVRNGYLVQAESSNVPDLLRKSRTLFPDLVIIDSNMEGGSFLEAAGIIENDTFSSVLIIGGESDHRGPQDYAYLNRPYTEETLLSVVEVSLLYRNRVNSMRDEITRLREDIQIRKLVEQAKGLIMRHLKVDEAQAYRMIQKESMNKGIPKKDIARAVILAYQMDENN